MEGRQEQKAWEFKVSFGYKVPGQSGLHKTLKEGKELVKGVRVKKERGRQVKGRKGESGRGGALNVLY